MEGPRPRNVSSAKWSTIVDSVSVWIAPAAVSAPGGSSKAAAAGDSPCSEVQDPSSAASAASPAAIALLRFNVLHLSTLASSRTSLEAAGAAKVKSSADGFRRRRLAFQMLVEEAQDGFVALLAVLFLEKTVALVFEHDVLDRNTVGSYRLDDFVRFGL